MNFSIRSVFADEYDSLYVQAFPKLFSLKLSLANRNYSFRIIPKIHSDTLKLPGVRYAPNLAWTMGVGGTFNNIQFNLMIKIPNTERDPDVYGNTKYNDIELNLVMRRVALRTSYRKFKGFYISNPESSFIDWDKESDYPKRSDISYQSLGAECFYVFNNKKYSLHATYKQSERQKQSVGSFLIKAKYDFLKIESDYLIIPPDYAFYYNRLKNLIGLTRRGFNVSAGYTYNFVIKKYFYIIPISFIGPAFINDYYVLTSGKFKDRYLTFISNQRLSCGYNGDVFFAGLITDWEGALISPNEIDINSSNFYMRLSFGLRF